MRVRTLNNGHTMTQFYNLSTTRFYNFNTATRTYISNTNARTHTGYPSIWRASVGFLYKWIRMDLISGGSFPRGLEYIG